MKVNIGVLAVFCFLTSARLFSLAYKQYHLHTFTYHSSKFVSDDFKDHVLAVSSVIQICLTLAPVFFSLTPTNSESEAIVRLKS